ncbi:MAG: Hsp20/alpha crystallin family protein [Armatimonadota bacterium]
MNNKTRDLLRRIELEMQRMTDEGITACFDPQSSSSRFWQPKVDVTETALSYYVKAELSGVNPEDIDVSLAPDGRFVTISGCRNENKNNAEPRTSCHQLEIYFGPFERRVALPVQQPIDRDRISARYREGFLIIELPKVEQVEDQTHKIPIIELTELNEE